MRTLRAAVDNLNDELSSGCDFRLLLPAASSCNAEHADGRWIECDALFLREPLAAPFDPLYCVPFRVAVVKLELQGCR